MSEEVKIRVQVASGDKKPFRITHNQNYDTSFLAEIFARFAINPTQVKPNQIELYYSDGDDTYTIKSQGDFNEFYKEAQTQAKKGGTLDLNVKLPGASSSSSTSPKTTTTSIPSSIRQSESKPPVSNGTANRTVAASISQTQQPRKPPGAGSHRPKQPSTTLAEASAISPMSTPREKQVLGAASGLSFEEAKEKWTTSIAIFNQSVKSGDIPKAIEHGTILLSLDPENATILYNRGVAYAAQEQHELAIADWTKCLNIQSNHAMALIGRGNAYAAIGNYAAALSDLKLATSLAPTSASAHHALSVTLTQMGEYESAIQSETKAIDLIEQKTSGSGAGVEMFELYYNRGWAHSRAGNHHKAIQDYTKSLSLNPRLIKANMSRAKVLRDTGDVNSAIDDYNKVVTTDTKNWKGFHERAVCWHLKDEIQKAIDDDTTSINIQPSFDAYYNRAIAYAKLGMLDKAIQDNTSALQHQPRNPHALCNRGVAHSALGHWPEAIADWTASIEAEPTVAALNARALAYYNNGEIDKALADWERSIAMCPEYNALVNRGNHWLSTGNPDRAIKDYTQAIGLKVPDPSAAYCNRAAAYCALGLWDEAIADCDAALAINPMLAQAWHNRGIAMAGKKNWDQSYLDHNMSSLIEPDNEVYRQARDDAKQLASQAALRQAERDTEEFYRKHPHLRPKVAERNEYKGAKGERGDFKGISPELYDRLKKMGLTDEEIAALADDNIRLTDEELADLMTYFPHLFKNGKLIIGDLTPEMKLRLAMYRQRVKKYPVLKRWKPLLAACIDSSTWAIQSQFAPLSTGGPQKAGQSKWKVQTNVRPRMS